MPLQQKSQAGAFLNCFHCGKKMRKMHNGKLRQPFCNDAHRDAYARKLELKQQSEFNKPPTQIERFP